MGECSINSNLSIVMGGCGINSNLSIVFCTCPVRCSVCIRLLFMDAKFIVHHESPFSVFSIQRKILVEIHGEPPLLIYLYCPLPVT